MTKEEHIQYWLDSAYEDFEAAKEIIANNRRKHFALFLGHLYIEKLLKALFVKQFDQVPPYKHDLYILASKCGIVLTNVQIENLKIINEFNIQARYPDYKNDFYKKCTNDFVHREIERIKETAKWIRILL
ncbi:MAG: HEPN domain-containing protein [Ignavibacteria bacterium]|nr:HEPN domain-containing protein [Ignavibacteria bacterium]OIO18114.1 MAG: hypothetical protein AUJ54_08820 [Ignavibacteria bacterium CG1_02_37_35]PIX95080.1 MAG: DNA-binding protein [Ignavibacteria bacterium CG_4_10_14_3_um_filter_37_18]